MISAERRRIPMEKVCPCHKTKQRTSQEMKALMNRLSRIEGQIRGLRGMIERDAYCTDILTQSAAAAAALSLALLSAVSAPVCAAFAAVSLAFAALSLALAAF